MTDPSALLEPSSCASRAAAEPAANAIAIAANATRTFDIRRTRFQPPGSNLRPEVTPSTGRQAYSAAIIHGAHLLLSRRRRSIVRRKAPVYFGPLSRIPVGLHLSVMLEPPTDFRLSLGSLVIVMGSLERLFE